MRACFFGTYNRRHTVNRIYASAMRAAGFELLEIHEPLWEDTRDKHASYFSPLNLLRLFGRWLAAAVRLARRWYRSGGAPVVLVGFNGQLDIVLLRLLAPRYGPRVVFAPLVSVTETLVEDRGVYRPGSIGARLLAALDRFTCGLADVVVTDTEAHRRYFVHRLGVDASRVVACHLGVDNDAFDAPPTPAAAATERAGKVEVLYFGLYQPLHGLDVIVDGVERLAGRSDVRFTFIGTGEHRPAFQARIEASGVDAEFLDWVPYEELGRRVSRADVVLGVFGSSAKARMVIPNKIYQAAAVGKAIVTADTPAIRELFTDGRDVVLCRADGADLATSLTRLVDDAGSRERIGAAARKLIAEGFSDEALGRAWARALGGRIAELAVPTPTPRLGVAVLNYNDAASTLRCLGWLAAAEYPEKRVLVVDNGSDRADRRTLEDGMAGRFAAKVRWLDTNSGYAGGNNAALRELFGDGCDYVLLLNNDTVVTPDALSRLVACATHYPNAGPIGPRVAKDWPGARTASLGERYSAALAWAPRTLLRYRRRRQRSYPVGGVMGCALLVTRKVYERLGDLDEAYFAYYEEVDYCLRARRAGLVPRVDPRAEIAHVGHRGFGSGMTPVAAYLKARNLWTLGREHVTALGWIAFAPGYGAMMLASMTGYALRGRAEILRALWAGAVAGWHGETGPPPSWVFAGSTAPVAESGQAA